MRIDDNSKDSKKVKGRLEEKGDVTTINGKLLSISIFNSTTIRLHTCPTDLSRDRSSILYTPDHIADFHISRHARCTDL